MYNQEMKNLYQILVGIPKGMRPFGNRHKDRKFILKWILKKHSLRVWTGFNYLRIRSNGRLL
jgi:hypothetical protein